MRRIGCARVDTSEAGRCAGGVAEKASATVVCVQTAAHFGLFLAGECIKLARFSALVDLVLAFYSMRH